MISQFIRLVRDTESPAEARSRKHIAERHGRNDLPSMKVSSTTPRRGSLGFLKTLIHAPAGAVWIISRRCEYEEKSLRSLDPTPRRNLTSASTSG
jgi:hypothetical protein